LRLDALLKHGAELAGRVWVLDGDLHDGLNDRRRECARGVNGGPNSGD
jgi:hypothetical protein